MVPARPSDNGVLEQGKALGNVGRRVKGSEMSALCNKGEKLRIWAEFCVVEGSSMTINPEFYLQISVHTAQ